LPSDGVGAKLSANYRQQLARNIDTLQVVWFKTRTAQYVQLPQEEREAFLVEQLAVIGSWTKVAALMEAAPIPPDEATSGLIARINHWVQVAQGAERDAMVAAVKDGTLCWLATTSLADRPLGMKRALAMHLAKELDKGASPRGELIRDASRRATLAENAGELVEAYVYCLADQFAQLPRAERTVFVDEQIAAVERWGIGELLASKEQSSQGGASAALALAEHSQRWIKNAPPQDREQVQSFVTSLQQRLVWKKLPAWLRGER
jgi:hypothetical protein